MRRGAQLVLLAVTLATAAIVAAGLPGISEIDGWFPGHRPLELGLGEAWAFAALLLGAPLAFVGVLALLRRGRRRLAALALLGAAFSAQLVMIPLDARGLDGVWERLAEGHGQLLRVGHERSDRFLETLRDYESLASEGELGVFARTKPPGALGAYMTLDRLSRWQPLRPPLAPLARDAARHPELEQVRYGAALSALLMPLLTALVAPLLVWLAWVLLGRSELGVAAAILWSVTPSVLLVTHHLDGALYPAVAVAACALAALGARRVALGWTAAAGALLGFGVYTSFSLLPAIPLAVGCVLALELRRDLPAPWARRCYRAGWQLAALAAGVLAMLWLVHAVLGFEPALRFERAMDYHDRWKRAVPTGPWRGWALVELALYLGFPLAVAWLARTGLALRRLAARERTPAESFAAWLLAVLLALTLSAGTNEVARLWLFLVPFFTLATASGLPRLARAGDWRRPVAWLAGCQLFVTLVLEANQPW